MTLPEDFLERMRYMLGDEFEDFLGTYEEPRGFGLRVNTLKISVEEFTALAPFHLKKIPWISNGFYYEKEDDPARHPFYYAGLYYLQEPSAMTPADLLPVTPGERVLDLCAAPGGKATALAAKLQGRGLLVANDISASRAKALLKNLELFGVSNSFVTTAVPAKLAEQFPETFDKILVDAPCSGEGMFRKDIANARAWSPGKVASCAAVQREITVQAVRMLRPGGLMLYSTCTFSVEENEGTVAYLLENCPELELVELPWREGFVRGGAGFCNFSPEIKTPGIHVKLPGVEQSAIQCDLEQSGTRQFSAGRSDAEQRDMERRGIEKSDAEQRDMERRGIEKSDAEQSDTGKADVEQPDMEECGLGMWSELQKCIRIFPHKMGGEGHFMALFRKRDCALQAEKVTDLQYLDTAHRKDAARVNPTEMNRDMESQENLAKANQSAVQGDKRMRLDSDVKQQTGYLQTTGANSRRSRKKAASGNGASRRTDSKDLLSGEEDKILRAFLEDAGFDVQMGRIETHDGFVYYVPERLPLAGKLPFLRNGLYLGERKRGRFEPAQSFAMALRGFASCIDFDSDDPRVRRYLSGDTVTVDDKNPARESGWQLVRVCGYPLGWGKLVNGILKNKYHPGWRMCT